MIHADARDQSRHPPLVHAHDGELFTFIGKDEGVDRQPVWHLTSDIYGFSLTLSNISTACVTRNGTRAINPEIWRSNNRYRIPTPHFSKPHGGPEGRYWQRSRRWRRTPLTYSASLYRLAPYQSAGIRN